MGSVILDQLRNDYEVIGHGNEKSADFMFDLSDTLKSFQMLTLIRPRVILNLVSLTNVDLCEDQPNMAYLANTRTVENIAYWIQKNETDCHLIQISTDHLYDSSELNAEDKITISNTYAFSKYAGELAASRVPCTILRTNFIGRSKTNHRQSFSDWVYTSLTNGKEIQVLDDVYFSPLSIRTLVELIQLVIEKKPVGIFNLGSHNGMSKANFSFFFAKCLDLPTHLMSRIEARQATFIKTYRPKDMRMNCSKFENILGIKLPEFTDEIIRVAKEYDEAC